MNGIRIAKEERNASRTSSVLQPGTLIHIDSNIAKVCWDSDEVEEEFDLCVPAEKKRLGDFFLLDNAPAGVVHEGFTCRTCHACPICGIRWKSRECDLCSVCYMAGNGSLNHSFNRILTPESCGDPVGKRAGCDKTEVCGVIAHTKVASYADVLRDSLRNESRRTSALEAKVEVASGGYTPLATDTEDGIQGAEAARPIPFYYKDHLVKLSKLRQINFIQNFEVSYVYVGDKVYTLLDEGALADILNKEPADQMTKISEAFGKVGVVEEVTVDNYFVVNFGAFDCKWPEFVFRKVPKIIVGEHFFVWEDEKVFRKLAVGHSGWHESMKEILGKECKVLNIDEDGDIKIERNGKIFLVNPLCLHKMERTQVATELPPPQNEKMEPLDDIDQHLVLITQALSNTEADHLVKAACMEGLVGPLLQDYADPLTIVNYQFMDHTALHVASYFGCLIDVESLLGVGADAGIKTPYGYTALHLAARRDDTGDIVKKLLQYGAKPSQNDNPEALSPLHLAVKYKKIEALKALLGDAKCDVNIQNSRRESPLHIAVEKNGDERILQLLLNDDRVDFSLSNDRGDNPLQLAALLGNARAVKSILQRVPELLMRSKENGFSPLHLAAYENNVEVAEILIEEKKLDVNATTKEKFTPLHLAACQGHRPMTSYLLKVGARRDMQDADGDTPLAMALQQNLVSLNSWESYSGDVRSGPRECVYCKGRPAQAFFKPCGHKIACTDCARKRTTLECKECKQGVRRSVFPDDVGKYQ